MHYFIMYLFERSVVVEHELVAKIVVKVLYYVRPTRDPRFANFL